MIPFVDLKAQYHSIKPEIDRAVLSVMESTQFVLGSDVAAFEKGFAAYCQREYALGLNSGTSALHLALLAAGIGPGDEVITVPFTFVATVAAIYYSGAKTVFVDINSESFTMDPEKLEAAITEKTRAVIPVHLFGQMADMNPILEIARKHNLVVIEDSAQAHGAEYHGRRAGSLGDMGCYSFYPGKNLGAYGEGGAIVTNNPEYYRKIKMLRDWGAEKKYQHVLKGYNYRMEGIQGAVLRTKLAYIEAWTEKRRENAAIYKQELDDAKVILPKEMAFNRHVYHVFAIRSTHRDELQQFLQEKGVQTGIHYPIPVHLLPAYEDLGYHRGDFPHSEKASDEVLSLPMYAELPHDSIREVALAIKAFTD